MPVVFSCLPEEAVLPLSVREAALPEEAEEPSGAEAAPASSCGALADASCSPLLDAAASSVSSSSVISPLSSLSRSSSVRVSCVLSAGAYRLPYCGDRTAPQGLLLPAEPPAHPARSTRFSGPYFSSYQNPLPGQSTPPPGQFSPCNRIRPICPKTFWADAGSQRPAPDRGTAHRRCARCGQQFPYPAAFPAAARPVPCVAGACPGNGYRWR